MYRLDMFFEFIAVSVKYANNGCTFFKSVFPVVEYLTCPKAEYPGSLLITEGFVK